MQNEADALAQRLLNYAAKIIKVITKARKVIVAGYVSNQLIRAATSAGANYEEACGAESRADFIHKMQLVLKELKESSYWLKLIIQAELMPGSDIEKLLEEAKELSRIFAKAVLTAKSNIK